MLSGDYPVEGYLGVAKPVFDLDSVGLLHLYAGLNDGRIESGVLGRAIARDSTRAIDALAPVRSSRGRPSAPTDFYLAWPVNPFKRLESELVPHYQKLALKAATGRGTRSPRSASTFASSTSWPATSPRRARARPSRKRLRPDRDNGADLRGRRDPRHPSAAGPARAGGAGGALR